MPIDDSCFRTQDGLFQVEGRTVLRSRASSLLPTVNIATTPTTPDMRSLESPAVVVDNRLTTDTLALPRPDSDSPPQFVAPTEAGNSQDLEM